MLPSLLARDIQLGIKQFLITGFEPADGFFHGVMRRFVDNEPAWLKGPDLQVGLPFRHDSAGRDFFNGFQTERPAYTHHREVWQRLASDRMATPTLVASLSHGPAPIVESCASREDLVTRVRAILADWGVVSEAVDLGATCIMNVIY